MRPFTFISICLLSFITVAWGQTASLRGQVKDESGALVPRPKVTITTRTNSSPITVAGDSTGVYTFMGLKPGSYKVSAAAPSLASHEPVPIDLVSGPQTLDLILKVAATQQQVTVNDDAATGVSTDPAANSSAIVLKGDDLAALADNPDDLAADLQALAGPSAGPGGGSIFIDGFSGGELPPKESIREIRINQNPFSPEYDKLGFGRIEIFTKPGADKYRGTVDYNFAQQFWNSRNPYAPTKAPLLLHEFEGGGGGPLGKRASFTLDAQRNMVDNGFIVNAVTVNPKTFAIQPYSAIYKTPQRFTRLSPRFDLALSDNQTLSIRYTFTTANINGGGIGTFDLPSRGYLVEYTHQTAQITETAVLGTAVNEIRFQYYRGANHTTAFNDTPALQVLGAFNDNGSAVGHSADTQSSYEFQNATSMLKGAHSIRFGVRLREQVDDNVSPNNFNGAFTFGGGLGPDINGAGAACPNHFDRTVSPDADPSSPGTFASPDPSLRWGCHAIQHFDRHSSALRETV